MGKRILVTGGRDFSDERLIEKVLGEWRKYGYDTIIHGAARGADSIADRVGRSYGYNVISVPAEWDKYGKPGMPPRRAAGVIRNQKMLDDYDPDVILAFHENLNESKGTKDMIDRARRAGKPVYLYPLDALTPEEGSRYR